MRSFTYSSQQEQGDIESILKERKKKIAKQQWLYTLLLLFILLILGLYFGRKVMYTEFDGYITTDINTVRMADDIFVLETHVKAGDYIVPGDTLFSYVYVRNFYDHENFNSEPNVVTHNRDIRVQYGLASQDLEVLRVRISELERQLETEDHNIRFGLSDNRNKMKTEQALAEAKEQYKAQARKLGVLRNAAGQTSQAVNRFHNGHYGMLQVQDMTNIKLMEELGLVRYSIAVDTALVTQVFVPEKMLVLRGEPLVSSQSFNLIRNNVSVVAYVMPRQMKHINQYSWAEVIVNDEVSFKASVLMLGTRTEEIPGELRSRLSRDHTSVVVLMEIDPDQVIPFWALLDNVPVRIRLNNFRKSPKRHDDYVLYHTTKGVIHSTLVKRDSMEMIKRGNNE